jgi:hypothetical protein
MKVPWVSVRVFEAKTPLAEVDFAGDSSVGHPLQRAVHSGAADTGVLPPDQVDEIVGAEMPFLPQKGVDDEVAFAGVLAPSGTDARNIKGG